MNIFYALLILVSALMAPLVRAGNLTFMINTIPADLTDGNSDYLDEQVYERIEKIFPDTRFISIRAQSNVDLYNELSFYVGPDTKIDAIVVNSHGGSSFLKDVSPYSSDLSNEYVLDGHLRKFGINHDSRDGKYFSINLQNPDKVWNTFRPVIGKFNPQAKLIFLGCNLVEAGDLADKFSAMRNVARNFGMDSGSVYMNETAGQNLSDMYIRQPFVAEETLLGAVIHLGVQLVSPISYPYVIHSERELNQGFSFHVSTDPEGRRSFHMYRDNVFNAQESQTPKGEEIVF